MAGAAWHWKRWQGKEVQRMMFSRRPLVLLNSSKYHSFVSASSALPTSSSLFAEGTESGNSRRGWWKSCSLTFLQEGVPPKWCSINLLSSFDKFEQRPFSTHHHSAEKRKDGRGKQAEHCTCNLKFFCTVQRIWGIWRPPASYHLHLCMLWDHSHTTGHPPAQGTMSLLHQLQVSLHLQGVCKPRGVVGNDSRVSAAGRWVGYH